MESGEKLYFGSKRDEFFEQLEKDAQFLSEMKIMDYSLLIGIHDPTIVVASQQSSPPSSPTPNEEEQRGIIIPNTLVSKFSSEDLNEEDVKITEEGDINVEFYPQTETKFGKFARIVSTEQQEDLPINHRKVYYIGIIDILQQYNLKKIGENYFKSLIFNSNEISAVDPAKYAKRFVEYIKDKLAKEEEYVNT